MAKTHLTVIGHRAGDAERLQTDTDGFGSLGSTLHALLDGDGGTADVSPLGILEADTLGLFTHLVGVDTCFLANLIGLFYAIDTVLFQSGQHLVDATLVTLE